MEIFLEILKEAVAKEATDIHMLEGNSPLYRINKTMVTSQTIPPLDKYMLEGLLETLVNDSMELVTQFEENKKLDLPYEYENVRLRINASMSNNVPTYSIRIIPSKEIDIESYGLKDIIAKMKEYNSGLILLTGKVNTGKTTTLNAFVQELNKSVKKKIVMLEEPIEYKHKSNKCLIVQKEVNKASDVPSYYDGVINLLREDSDVAIIGEIRDKKTMNAVLDLSEAGGLVIGTMHTRSCGETLERILALYGQEEQKSIKFSLSNVLQLIISQKLVKNNEDKIMMVPEIMVVTNTMAALIRQEKFNISEIRDAIHIGSDEGMISFEQSFAGLLSSNKISNDELRKHLDKEELELVNKILGGVE